MVEYLFWAIMKGDGSESEYIENFRDTKSARAFAASLFKTEPIGMYGNEYALDPRSKIPFNAKIVDVMLKKHLGTVVLYNGKLYWMVIKSDGGKHNYQLFYPMKADGSIGTKGTRSISMSGAARSDDTRYFISLYKSPNGSELMPFNASDIYKARVKAANIVSRYPPYPGKQSSKATLYKGTPQDSNKPIGEIYRDSDGTYIFEMGREKHAFNPTTGRLGRRL